MHPHSAKQSRSLRNADRAAIAATRLSAGRSSNLLAERCLAAHRTSSASSPGRWPTCASPCCALYAARAASCRAHSASLSDSRPCCHACSRCAAVSCTVGPPAQHPKGDGHTGMHCRCSSRAPRVPYERGCCSTGSASQCGHELPTTSLSCSFIARRAYMASRWYPHLAVVLDWRLQQQSRLSLYQLRDVLDSARQLRVSQHGRQARGSTKGLCASNRVQCKQ